MKFTKFTSAALASASMLSIFAAPVATFAKTTAGSTTDNGGVVLPQTDTTTAGIAFGDNKPNANTGSLRLQKVPEVLDFGNHANFNTAYTTFTADGKNYANGENDTKGSYDNTTANKTTLLQSDDKSLADVQGTAWATVVDKQVTRDQASLKNPGTDTTQAAGDWTLSVQADGTLKSASGQELSDAQLLFKNTKTANTQEIFKLTNEDQDSSFTNDMSSLDATKFADDKAKGIAPVSDVTKSFAVDLASTASPVQVAAAKINEGTGADVFGWNPDDIQLVLPATTSTSNASYSAKLTWTLATGK